MTTPASLSGTPCPPHVFPSEAISVCGPLSAEIALSGRVVRWCGGAWLHGHVGSSCLHVRAHVCGVGRACMCEEASRLRLGLHLAE